MGSSGDTRTLILDTAERLFAARGIHGVSVRQILAEAGLNLALAHYHFGDRNGLILAVLERRTRPVNEERVRLLDQLESVGRPTLEAILQAFFAPAIGLIEEQPAFARILGHLHVTPDSTLRHAYFALFEVAARRFSDAIKKTLPPEMSGSQRLCRGHFLLGALIHTLTSFGDMELMARGRYPVPRGKNLLRELVAFCKSGLLAGMPDSRDGDGP